MMEVEIDGTYFSFPESWRVELFDEWKQYRALSGAVQLHGCDVVALDDDRLWLIEMKDYSYPGAREPSSLDDVLIRKAIGTLALLSALGRSQNHSSAQDFSVASLQAREIYLALHVELPVKRPERAVPGLLMSYQQMMKRAARRLHLARGLVTSTLEPQAHTPWTSRRDPDTRIAHLRP